jgi:hypothetical protein
MERRMTSIDCLRDEHRRIVTMLSALDAVADRLERDIEAARTLTANDESTLRQAFEALDSTRAALQEVVRWERLAEQVQATGVSR